MTEIKGNLMYLQIPLTYLRNTAAELKRNTCRYVPKTDSY
jgi:hypothetical protein